MGELTAREALITLNLVPGLGSVRIRSLLEFFGSAELALHAPQQMLAQVPRLGEKAAAALADWRHCTQVHAELECAEQLGARVITFLDEEYPDALRRMSDPPVVLYVLGAWQQEDAKRAVSLVGTRVATPYGMSCARRFARELADHAGCTIISGLARGIDTAGHWGALDADGRTVAVLGGGLGQLFPAENAELVERIIAGHGAVVSEFPMNMRPSRNTFPQRNRIVAAWSKATLVAEASSRSGALHTARLSAEFGNQVFAIPGAITSIASLGCNRLIRDGAILCNSPQELIADMGWDQAPRQLNLFDTPTAALPREQDPLLAAIAAGHNTLDALCSALGQPAHELTPRLMRLQIERKVLPGPGGQYELSKAGA